MYDVLPASLLPHPCWCCVHSVVDFLGPSALLPLNRAKADPDIQGYVHGGRDGDMLIIIQSINQKSEARDCTLVLDGALHENTPNNVSLNSNRGLLPCTSIEYYSNTGTSSTTCIEQSRHPTQSTQQCKNRSVMVVTSERSIEKRRLRPHAPVCQRAQS